MSPMQIDKMRTPKGRRKTQGQIKNTYRAVQPKYRIGSLIGTEKSKRPVSLKGLDPMQIKTHMDTTSVVDQSGVAYFGFPDAGSQDEQLLQGCYALVNMFYRRSGFKPIGLDVQWDDYLSNTQQDVGLRLQTIRFQFTRKDADGNGQFENVDIPVTSTSTIRSVGIALATLIKGQAYAPGTTDPDGKWPAVAHLLSQGYNPGVSAGTNFPPNVFASYDLENVMVEFAAMRKYKWQNVTPAMGAEGFAGTNINDISANPLSGRIYKFKGPTPLVRPKILNQLSTVMRDRIEAQGSVAVSGASPPGVAYDYISTEAFRDNSFSNNLDGPFRQPFKANQFFKNALTEDKVYMPPGGYKQLIRKTATTMNFRRFAQATVYIQGSLLASQGYIANKPSKIGTSTLWGLEPAVRTTDLEHVKLAVNIETWFTSKCRVATKKQPVVTDIKVLAGHTFGT